MLELIKGLTKLAGNDVVVMDELRDKFPDKFNPSGGMDYKWFEKEIRPYNHIYIRQDVNSISFTLKKGELKGCDLNAVISAVIEMIHASSLKYPPEAAEKKDIEIKDKYKQVLDNLLFAFKHLKELREMEGKESAL